MSKTKKTEDIERLRKKIDQIDLKLSVLLKERARLASKIILAKKCVAAPAVDLKREQAIVRRYLATLTRPIKIKRVHTLVKAILELTPEYRR